MSTQRVGPGSSGGPDSSSGDLHGRWLVLARAAWVAVVFGTSVLFAAALPGYYSVLYDACRAGPCIGGQASSGDMSALHDLGLPIGLYAAYVIALDLLVAVVFCAVGAIIYWRRSRNRGALFASFALAMFGLTWPGAFEAVRRFGAWGEAVGGFLVELGLASLVVLLLVFPDGRFVPRWTRWVAAFALVQLVCLILFPGSFLTDPPQAINVSAFVGLWAVCFFAQAYRYKRVSGPIERQQVKWLVFGVAALVALLCAYFLPLAFFPQLAQRGGAVSLSYDLIGRALVGSFAFLLIPLSIGVAVLRYRLYDIDLIINRALVYGSLSVLLAAAYLGGVVGSQYAFRVVTGQGSTLAVVASTLAIAALFAPLRRRVQAFVDRRFYRRKYDAAKTLETFSANLRKDTDLDALRNDLVGVARRTVQPAHVSLWLRPDPEQQAKSAALSRFGHE
jgi:hypothetical protein